ncbi:RNA polymerase sigma factor [Botrimarina hoheduenensis]|uniref:ECF RNA polymerase sigma factor SigW n=1 Tax=Botrimarina hoheduenensis TaxID=2528000 RepID=A0A5C5W954_9BACT|nr:RNA polymerase sigma factor [Botrimarina hoheduenensis]TWT46541.1 ECF RNA polymerase sigma factor SigW [Botrimarina hoheduenensis]
MPTLTTQNRQNATDLDRIALEDLADEQLLTLHQQAGPSAADRPYLATLIKRYERELFSFLRRYLGDAALAEDAFQATFLQVHRKGHLFDTSRKFRPWLYTVATNRAIDLQRRNKRHQAVSLDRSNRSEHAEVGSLRDLLASSEAGPGERFESAERTEWVRRAVAALPEQLRSAVSLVYFKGMKYREAAVELDIPVGTVKSRLHSAVGQLGQQWRETHPGS